MIVIVSNVPGERAAFGALCKSRAWPWIECASLRAFRRLLRTDRPAVAITRNRLGDGYSDEAIAALQSAGLSETTKLIVLLMAGSPSSTEARQIALGADLVQRDPVRSEVLLEYVHKYLNAAKKKPGHPSARPSSSFEFAGARVNPVDRKLEHRKTLRSLTQREVELAEILAESPGQVVTYDTLFDEILGRPFHGDTSNLRVLLRKLAATLRHSRIDLRRWVEVIPKLGYRYHSEPK